MLYSINYCPGLITVTATYPLDKFYIRTNFIGQNKCVGRIDNVDELGKYVLK